MLMLEVRGYLVWSFKDELYLEIDLEIFSI